MPINIPDSLPAKQELEAENIFVMSEQRAISQDIRPLRIVILNLMPKKITTETQLLRRMSNSPLQVEVDLMRTTTYQSKNTPEKHLFKFYNSFDELKHKKYDGMIITGAPVEHLEFEQVDYWGELCQIMEWSKTNVTSTFHICWGAQAGLYYHYGIQKYPLKQKMFGIYKHKKLYVNSTLMRGIDDTFYVPHSRHTEVHVADIEANEKLFILSTSDAAGVYIVTSRDNKQFFVTGHSEYDALTLHEEYMRDKEKGLDIAVPYNYYPDDDSSRMPKVCWRSHSTLLFGNWLNYYVYQQTPYALDEI